MSIFRKGLFAGKVALVTGGATGIGKAISNELLSLGCKVVIASRDLEKLKVAAEEMSKIGQVTPLRCNIRNEEDVKNTVKDILSRHGKIDFLINNGGGQFPCPADSMTLKGWNAVIETNLTGTYLMSREVYNQYQKANGGCIINIICDMFKGFPMMSHTGAARAAVENLTKSLSIEWASNGVRVNAVAPGIIFSQTAKDNYAVDVFSMAEPYIPAKRLGTPNEVSSAVCFLLSPGAAFITGATLRVDGASSLYCPMMWPIDGHDKMPPYEWDPLSEENPKSKL